MSTLIEIAIWLALGAGLWTFAEYALHHWLGHLPRGQRPFSREHLAHHTDTTYFTPTRLKILAGLAVAAGAGPLAVWGLGPWSGVALVAGFVGGYAFYEITHRRTHTHAPIGAYGRWTHRHHLTHHFNKPHHNHGVSTPLWDMIFGTYYRAEKVRVPRRHAMEWLVDPQTGEVREEYRDDYVLVGRGDARG
jgi:sterol desaturase/sphingolipid hydroxylase (fatty acid hydroxylase superfamily)